MSKAGLYISAEATAVQGPRGLSIKEFRFKETLSNGDNIYQVILENNTIIGELTAKKGDKGNVGAKGETGNGIKIVEKIDEENKTKRYRMTFTNGQEFDWSTEDGDTAYEVAVDNGFNGTEEEWLESLIGKGLEFEWRGTELGVRVEGETEYKYVNLKGQTGEAGKDGVNGKNLEFTWRGTELGVRVQGQSNYQYVNLKGEKGDPGQNGTNGADGNGIKDMTFKETDSQGNNIYTITFTNGKTFDITVPRGPKGEGATIDLSNYYTKKEVDNELGEKLGTNDKAKSSTTADKLSAARNINGVAFDGTKNITVEDSTKYPNTGGTVSGNQTITGNQVVNGSTSCKSLVINGWTVTITD